LDQKQTEILQNSQIPLKLANMDHGYHSCSPLQRRGLFAVNKTGPESDSVPNGARGRRGRPRVARQLPPQRQAPRPGLAAASDLHARSATPCGHAYHPRCVVSWLDAGARTWASVAALRGAYSEIRVLHADGNLERPGSKPCFAVIIACRVVSCLSRRRCRKSSSTI
jgi:hypothetical protein